ncbi:unnamed protein product [Rotaria sp. Silwood1]|nr:unnamed protein product [Rotaria sp. Silwood1]CAF4737964.1 unnamed protein product [Rotaria sp. Silwood1]CAF4923533.1 unnamed protein product [Rotaria sp. Silwood1]
MKSHEAPTQTNVQQQTVQYLISNPLLSSSSTVLSSSKLVSNPIIENLSTQSVSDSPIPNLVPNLSLQSNRLSDYLFDTFTFADGTELLVYAKLVTGSSTCMDAEHDRLTTRIQSRYNGQDIFQLDEYARFINALKKLLTRSQSSSSSQTAEEPAQCTIS